MSIQPPELIDPYERFWSAARDTSVRLTPAEEQAVNRVERQSTRASTEAEIVLALGAAFMVYRDIMARKLASVGVKEPTMLQLVVGSMYQALVPSWVRMVAPALIRGFRRGIREARAGDVPEYYLRDIADAYARKLGDHVNEVSTEALVNGFQAQINRKVPVARAMENVMRAYGVSPRAMNALVSVWMSEDPKRLTNAKTASVRDERAKEVIAKELQNRAKTIGNTEAWASKSQGKQVVWAYGLQQGMIPKQATRVWVTANDERVCPVCGPLHRKEAKVDTKFKTASGQMWTPPAHPNCRCDVILSWNVKDSIEAEYKRLLAAETVSKAEPQYKRDQKGRFAEVNSLRYKDPRPVDPTIQRLFREAQIRYALDTSQEATTKVNEKIGGAEKIGSKINEKISAQKIGGKIGAEKTEGKISQKISEQDKIRHRIKSKRITSRIDFNMEKIKGDAPKNDSPPGYQRLEEPLFMVTEEFNLDTKNNMIFLSDNDELVTNPAIFQGMIKAHWNAFLDERFEDIREQAATGEAVVSVKGPRGDYVQVELDVEDVQDALIAEFEERDLDIQIDAQYEDESGNERTIPVSYREISEFMGFRDHIEENVPVLVVMTHANQDTIDLREERSGGGMYGSNAGAWKIGKTEPGGGAGSFMFTRVYLDPPDQ